MKQSDIKEDRFYRGRRSKGVREVTEIFKDDDGVPCLYWRIPGKVAEKDTTLQAFARWAGNEVVQQWLPVRRCHECDSILTWDEHSGMSLCKKCG